MLLCSFPFLSVKYQNVHKPWVPRSSGPPVLRPRARHVVRSPWCWSPLGRCLTWPVSRPICPKTHNSSFSQHLSQLLFPQTSFLPQRGLRFKGEVVFCQDDTKSPLSSGYKALDWLYFSVLSVNFGELALHFNMLTEFILPFLNDGGRMGGSRVPM